MNIELSGISHHLDQHQWLKDINFSVQSGQCVVISGRSGSGKSLLFSIVCGILAADSGEVLVDGQAISQMTELQDLAFRSTLGAIFQVAGLISNLTLAENLLLRLDRHYPEQSYAQKRQTIETICREFGLEGYLEQRVVLLSTGLASLAGLARALLIPPKCIVWDAPLAEIDLRWCEHVRNRLRRLKAQGVLLILFSNRQNIIDELADQHYVLSAGHLERQARRE